MVYSPQPLVATERVAVELLHLQASNVCPCVPRRTVSRDESIVLESLFFFLASLRSCYSYVTFFNYLSLRRPLSNIKKSAVDYAVDRFNHATDRRSELYIPD
jgi:hypothetical protein